MDVHVAGTVPDTETVPDTHQLSPGHPPRQPLMTTHHSHPELPQVNYGKKQGRMTHHQAQKGHYNESPSHHRQYARHSEHNASYRPPGGTAAAFSYQAGSPPQHEYEPYLEPSLEDTEGKVIEVTGIDAEVTSHADVEAFFQHRRRGGPIQHLDFEPTSNTYIITFKDRSGTCNSDISSSDIGPL